MFKKIESEIKSFKKFCRAKTRSENAVNAYKCLLLFCIENFFVKILFNFSTFQVMLIIFQKMTSRSTSGDLEISMRFFFMA